MPIKRILQVIYASIVSIMVKNVVSQNQFKKRAQIKEYIVLMDISKMDFMKHQIVPTVMIMVKNVVTKKAVCGRSVSGPASAQVRWC